MIIIGSDHAGYRLKESIKKYLVESGEVFEDLGTYSEDSCDYPIFAERVARSVVNGEEIKGILICGSGIGVSIAANKVKGVRAALCMNSELAEMSRRHNDANILCIAARYTDLREAKNMVKVFLNTGFEGGRHQRRVKEIKDIENNV